MNGQESKLSTSSSESQQRLWRLGCYAAVANLALCVLLRKWHWSDLAYPVAMLQLSVAHLTRPAESWIRSVAWVVMIVAMSAIIVLGP
jgi:hypothetical protein